MARLPATFLSRPIAHRALHGPGRPENSRAAVRAAVRAGYGIEIDLQASRDGAAMVFHDADLDRMTGARGPVRNCTAGDLAAVALRDSAESVPTLPEVLDIVAGAVPLLVELKDGHAPPDAGPGSLEHAAAAAVADYDGPVAFMSFSPRAMAAMARLCPDRPRGLTTCAYHAADFAHLPEATRAHLRDMPGLAAAQASFVSHDHRDLDAPVVTRRKAEGLHVLCWTVRSPAEEAAARRVAENVTFEGYAA